MQGTFRKRRHHESNFELQITALIDTLVIILIFLLKSVATDSLEVDQGKGITIPSVMNGMTAGKGSRLEVSSTGVVWNGQKTVEMKDFDIKHPLNGETGLSALNSAIATSVIKEKADNSFDGALLFQADKSAPLVAIQEVLKIAKSHGYKDIRFIGAKYN